MAALTGRKPGAPDNTYEGLLNVDHAGGIDTTLREVQDGLGNNSALMLSTSRVAIAGDLQVSGTILNFGGTGGAAGTYLLPMGMPETLDDTLFSWVNQGSASTATANNTVYFSDSNVTSTENARLRVMTAPATPYTITMAFAFQPHYIATALNAGICIRDSGGTKFNTYGFIGRSNGLLMQSYSFNSPTSFSATNHESSNPFPVVPILWVRLTDDGTNRKHYTSIDGIHWSLQWSEGRTTFLTANQVGYYINSVGGSSTAGEAGIVILGWGV